MGEYFCYEFLLNSLAILILHLHFLFYAVTQIARLDRCAMTFSKETGWKYLDSHESYLVRLARSSEILFSLSSVSLYLLIYLSLS